MAGPDNNETEPKRPAAAAERVESDASGEPDDFVDLEAELNGSLHEVLDLLARQVAYLKTSLDFVRSSDPEHQQRSEASRRALIRWHVEEIDERQDRMDEIQAMILEKGHELH